MTRRKFKLTGFARFFIAMLILAPLAYIGASYINGEDGIENIKDFFSSDSEQSDTKTLDASDVENSEKYDEDILEKKRQLEEEIRKKNQQIKELDKKLEEEM